MVSPFPVYSWSIPAHKNVHNLHIFYKVKHTLGSINFWFEYYIISLEYALTPALVLSAWFNKTLKYFYIVFISNKNIGIYIKNLNNNRNHIVYKFTITW